MRLSIYSLKKIEFEGEATALTVKTTTGEITLLDHHVPLITLLAPHQATITTPDRSRTRLNISGGFLEMNRQNTLTVLAD